MDSKLSSEVRLDLKNLMSCIQCHDHTNQIEVIMETFKTIVQICTNESNGKDAFREEGGLEFLIEFLTNTDSSVLLEHSLKTLAFTVDENIPNQMRMTKDSVFLIIKTILLKESFHDVIHKNALLLLSAIMYQNNAAQILLYETEILQDLVSLYKNIFPTLSMKSSYSIPNMEEESVELWLRLNSTLCFAVNNPQNEKNQEICSVLFSPSLIVLETSTNNIIITAVSSFLSLCMSNNAKNQDYFDECDGLLTLKRCFQKHYEFLLLDAEECNNIIGKGILQTLNSLVGIISAAATNHEKNAYTLGKIGLISLMIKLLFFDMLDIQHKTRLYLSLGHCVDASCSNKSFILETEKFDVLLKKTLETDNDELLSACNYLLQVCILETENKERDDSNDKLLTSRDKRKLTSSSSLVSEKPFSNKMPEFKVVNHEPSVTGSSYKFSSPDLPPDIKMYLLSKTQGESIKSLKASNTKRSKGVKPRVSAKRLSNPYISPQSLSTSDQNSKATISVFDSASEISFSPSNISCSKRCCQNKLKRKRNNIDSHSFKKSIRNSSVISYSLEDESREIKRSLENLEELKESIKNMNHSFNQIFSSVSNLNNSTVRQDFSENNSMFGMPNECRVDSLMPKSRTEFSDIRNSKLGDLSTPLFCVDQTENSVFKESTSEINKYPQRLKEDQSWPFKFCKENFKPTADQDMKSNFHSSPEFSENSSNSGEFREVPFAPNMLTSRYNEVDCGRTPSNPLFSTFEELSEPSEKVPDSNFMKVLVFPWNTCYDHGLISSFEMLQVVSIEDQDY